MSAGHVSGTCGSGIVSSASDVLWMSLMRGMRGAGGVCEICMRLALGVVGGEVNELMRGLGLGFPNPVGTGGIVGRMSVFRLWWCEWCRWGVGMGLGPRSGWMGWCYVCVSCKSGLSV